MKRTPEEEYKLLRRWQACDQSELRVEARAAIRTGRINDSLLLRRITRVWDCDLLYRGMRVAPSDPLASLPVGETFEMQPSSWSRKYYTAELFTITYEKQHPDYIPIFMVMTGEPIRGFDLASYLGSIDLKSHIFAEVICAGRFRLLARTPLRHGWMLGVHQTAIFETKIEESR